MLTSAAPFAFFNEETFNLVEAERFAPIADRQQQAKQQELVLQQQRLLHHRTVGAVPLPPTTAQETSPTAAGAAPTTPNGATAGEGCPATLGTTGAAGGWIPATKPLLDPYRHDISVHALPDAAYLEACIIPLLIPALQETARAVPQDPIAFLAAYLLSNNPQRDDLVQMEQLQIAQGVAATPTTNPAATTPGSTQHQLSQHLLSTMPVDGLVPQHPVLYGRLLAPPSLMRHYGLPPQPLDGEGMFATSTMQQQATSVGSDVPAAAPAPFDVRRHRADVMQTAVERAVAYLSGRTPPSLATPPSAELPQATATPAPGASGGVTGRRASTPPTYPAPDRRGK